MSSLRLSLAAAVFLAPLALGPDALAQRSGDPAGCSWCQNDPALMKAAGIVSHGGFEFGNTDTKRVDGLLATSDIRWIESAHFELGLAIGPMRVQQEQKEKIRAELSRLAQVLPAVDPRTKQLDPWLRAHLYAQRMEDVWTRMLAVLQVQESDFPQKGETWLIGEDYRGNGPYMGQAGKYEVLILPSEAAHMSYLKENFGLLMKRTQRWNFLPRDTVSVTIHIQQADLRNDEALHGHVVFNLAISMLDGYKHYNFETPIWIREGLGHVLEREIDPKHNSFDSSEGGVAEMSKKEKWEPEVRKVIARGAPRMAELVNLKDFAELTLDHHFVTWSMVDYLMKTNPEGFACLNDRIHGHVGPGGMPSGEGLRDAHREYFKECLGMSYAEFDTAWETWVQAAPGS